MQIFNSVEKWRSFRQQDLLTDKTIGFVATMGDLHAGHISLLKRSAQENAISVLSIFVNPAQFDDSADYDHYPRRLKQDISIAQDCAVDFLLAPDNPQSLYPDNYDYKITASNSDQQMEGKYRHGHFEGVLTIVAKFLQLVKPTRAYFGEKDFQQLNLVKGMVAAFFMDTEIIAYPTIRTEQGLALSSRNRRLSKQQQAQANIFAKLLHSDRPLKEIKQALQAQEIIVDYIEEHQGRRYAAVRLGSVRLIDNIELSQLNKSL